MNALYTDQRLEKRRVYFLGKSKVHYPFVLYPIDADLPDVGAVYIFTRAKIGIDYKPLFIGQTDRLVTCIQNHEKWRDVSLAECNSICVLFEDDERERLRIERGLIAQQQPEFNDLKGELNLNR